MKKLIFLLPVFFVLSGCNFQIGCNWDDCLNQNIQPEQKCDDGDGVCDIEYPLSDLSDQSINDLSLKVVETLKNSDMTWFAEFVDPTKWVQFSAYWNMQDSDIVLSRSELVWLSDEIFTWWMYDGSWDPIKLTLWEFLNDFVYNHDYSQAPEVIFNSIVSRWNTIVNIDTYFQDAEFVEYYFPSFNPEYAGMDWESLVLIFDKNTHFLIGVAHEQWTI
jgi:hypothetical protein